MCIFYFLYVCGLKLSSVAGWLRMACYCCSKLMVALSHTHTHTYIARRQQSWHIFLAYKPYLIIWWMACVFAAITAATATCCHINGHTAFALYILLGVGNLSGWHSNVWQYYYTISCWRTWHTVFDVAFIQFYHFCGTRGWFPAARCQFKRMTIVGRKYPSPAKNSRTNVHITLKMLAAHHAKSHLSFRCVCARRVNGTKCPDDMHDDGGM